MKFAPNPPNLHHGKWTGKTFSHYLGHLLEEDMCCWVDQLSILGRWSGPTFNDGNPYSMGILTRMELGWWDYPLYITLLYGNNESLDSAGACSSNERSSMPLTQVVGSNYYTNNCSKSEFVHRTLIRKEWEETTYDDIGSSSSVGIGRLKGRVCVKWSAQIPYEL